MIHPSCSYGVAAETIQSLQYVCTYSHPRQGKPDGWGGGLQGSGEAEGGEWTIKGPLTDAVCTGAFRLRLRNGTSEVQQIICQILELLSILANTQGSNCASVP